MQTNTPPWIEPMEPISTKERVCGPNWIHQVKWDGIRGLTYLQGDSIRIFTKKGRERSAYYPEITLELGMALRAADAVLDGELVVLDGDGRPSFQRVLTRERVRGSDRIRHYTGRFPALYILFDCMRLNGRDLTQQPQKVRREQLKAALRPSTVIALTDDYEDGDALWQLMVRKGWEGMVSKSVMSPYLPGKQHKLWLKQKLERQILGAVFGIGWRGDQPNGLVLGVFQEGIPRYIGKASLGLTQQDFKMLKAYAVKHDRSENPFVGLRFTERVTWVPPAVTCWTSFLEWTQEGVMRHPKILGFSSAPPEAADGRETLRNA